MNARPSRLAAAGDPVPLGEASAGEVAAEGVDFSEDSEPSGAGSPADSRSVNSEPCFSDDINVFVASSRDCHDHDRVRAKFLGKPR